MIRTFGRQMAREGKQIRIVKGVPQYVKVKQTKQEHKKEKHDFLLKGKEPDCNLYSSKGKFAKKEATK